MFEIRGGDEFLRGRSKGEANSTAGLRNDEQEEEFAIEAFSADLQSADSGRKGPWGVAPG